jgi:hypothetical protein
MISALNLCMHSTFLLDTGGLLTGTRAADEKSKYQGTKNETNPNIECFKFKT